ncbi:MAG: NAD-binding protein, partial [Mycobacteriales bacterium]
GNATLNRKSAGRIDRDAKPGSWVDLHQKDVGIVTSAARAAGVAIPLGAQVAQLLGAARAQGNGDLDHTALLLLVEQLSGRSPAGASPTTGPTTTKGA